MPILIELNLAAPCGWQDLKHAAEHELGLQAASAVRLEDLAITFADIYKSYRNMYAN